MSANAEVVDGFESPETSWSLVDADCPAQLAAHLRQFKDAYRGLGCEYLRLTTGQGSYAFLSHDIQTAPIIEELAVSVWVKSDRPGIQLRLRVVLPRTEDPRTGKPMTTFLVGTTYRTPGSWQQLVVERPHLLLQRQQAVLRSQFGQHVDVRQAYVDRVVLNAHGGASITNLWIDELEVSGVVLTATRRNAVPLVTNPAFTQNVETNSSANVSAPAPTLPPRERAELHGSQLLVGGRPWLPRAVRPAGHGLATLKELGFNTVVLARPATDNEQREAAQLGLWLITPPPADLAPPIIATVSYQEPSATLRFPSILAWSLDRPVTTVDTPSWVQRASDLRQLDNSTKRLLIGTASDHWQARSRTADLLIASLPPNGWPDRSENRREWWDYIGKQLRPGATWWATVAVQPRPDSARSNTEVGARRGEVVSDSGDLRLATYDAIVTGARGIVFELPPADATSSDQRELWANLRALNAELQLLEPWIAGGRGVEQLATRDDRCETWVLPTDRARLVIVLSHVVEPAPTKSRRARPPAPLTFVDGGASSAADAYLIHGADFRPQARRRVTGGVEVTIDSPAPVSLVVLTAEPVVVNYLARTLSERRSAFRP